MVTFTGIARYDAESRVQQIVDRSMGSYTWEPGQPFPDLIEVFRVLVEGEALKTLAGNTLSTFPVVRGERCEWGSPWASWIWDNRYELFQVPRPTPPIDDDTDTQVYIDEASA